MPARLRPTADLAEAAVLVGDPGRALLLAQELIVKPKMSNHARGLWGYTGETPEGRSLTVQATGMGAPSALAVLDDLAGLGVRRAVRIGTCAGIGVTTVLGGLLLVDEAVSLGGGGMAVGLAPGDSALPDADLHGRLAAALGDSARGCRVGSLDALGAEPDAGIAVDAADLQTAALLARSRALGVRTAAALVVAEIADGESCDDELLAEGAKRAGAAAAAVL